MAVNDIISTQWLNEHITDPIIRVLDVTWYSSKNAYEEYTREHIPGAVHFDIFKDVHNTDVHPRSLPEADVFERNARAAGVNSDSHVVVYDSEGRNGFFLGSRAWFMFSYFGQQKISILDGGLQKWKSDGFSTSSDIPSVSEGNFKANPNSSLLTKFDFMKGNLTSKATQVLDSRASDGYRGKAGEKKTGHYPGAISVPFADNLLDSSLGTFKNPEELRTVLRESGVDTERPVVAMCNSGMSSCSLLLAAKVAGIDNFSLYQAGFSEWKSQADESQIEQS